MFCVGLRWGWDTETRALILKCGRKCTRGSYWEEWEIKYLLWDGQRKFVDYVSNKALSAPSPHCHRVETLSQGITSIILHGLNSKQTWAIARMGLEIQAMNHVLRFIEMRWNDTGQDWMRWDRTIRIELSWIELSWVESKYGKQWNKRWCDLHRFSRVVNNKYNK